MTAVLQAPISLETDFLPMAPKKPEGDKADMSFKDELAAQKPVEAKLASEEPEEVQEILPEDMLSAEEAVVLENAPALEPVLLIMQDAVVELTPAVGTEAPNEALFLKAVASTPDETSLENVEDFVQESAPVEKGVTTPIAVPITPLLKTQDTLVSKIEGPAAVQGPLLQGISLEQGQEPTKALTTLVQGSEGEKPFLKTIPAHLSALNIEAPAANINRVSAAIEAAPLQSAASLDSGAAAQLWQDLDMKFNPKPLSNDFELTLTAPNKGKIHFALEEAEGKVKGVIIVEDADVFAQMKGDIKGLAELLAKAGYEGARPEDLHFEHNPGFFGEGQNQKGGFNQGQKPQNPLYGLLVDDQEAEQGVTAALNDGRTLVYV